MQSSFLFSIIILLTVLLPIQAEKTNAFEQSYRMLKPYTGSFKYQSGESINISIEDILFSQQSTK